MSTLPRPSDASELFAHLLAELQEGRTPDVRALCEREEISRSSLRAAWLDWIRGRHVLGGPTEVPVVEAFLEHEFEEESGELPAEPHSPSDSAWSEVLEDLAKHSPGPGRYRKRGEIARGGMGAILKVWDGDLKRSLAKKVLLSHPGARESLGDKSLGRFLEEAQVTAQLEHPGIVPVHDLGVDPEDGVYFTMRLVRGRDLRAVFQQVRDGAAGWNLTRALGVLLKVCEAMAYAHSRNIVHRDLKPANVMVGRFGEVYVMDWGLARVLGSESESEHKPEPQISDLTDVTTLRAALAAGETDSPLFTQDGAIIGTPAFMSPEQARGQLDEVGPRSDVYSVGAILYQLLTSHMPYGDTGTPVGAHTALQRLLAGTPTPVLDLAPETPAELVAICERAMAREPAERFDNMLEFADDLRAFLEHRVVRSYRTGAVPELIKWVQRNSSTAAALAALFVVSLGGAGAVAWQQHRMAVQAMRAHDLLEAPALIAEMNDLGPLSAEGLPALERWVASAEDLLTRLPSYRNEFENALADTGRTWPPPRAELTEIAREEEFLTGLSEELEFARLGSEDGEPMEETRIASALEILPPVLERSARRSELLRATTLPRAEFADSAAQEEHDQLRSMLQELIRFSDDRIGPLAMMRRRIDAARAHPRSLEDPRWEVALASISNPEECPAYGGLALAPQPGLVPLQRNTASGLWEFLHVLSGAPPEHDAQGNPRVKPETGIVLVLMPAGEFVMGAQRDEPTEANYDPQAREPEFIMTSVALEPFFLSKYELTRAQWMRAMGNEPGFVPIGIRANGSPRQSPSHPVESVSYEESAELLQLWGLALPTEAQLEYAARAGTTLRYGSSNDFADVRPFINSWNGTSLEVVGDAVDGHYLTAPVDSFPPNRYGLHSVLGNVREWCLEAFASDLDDLQIAPGTGELSGLGALARTTRGGSFLTSDPPFSCRVSSRLVTPPHGDSDVGLRPARRLDR